MWNIIEHTEIFRGTYKDKFWCITKKRDYYEWSIGYHGIDKNVSNTFDKCKQSIIDFIDTL